MAKSIKPTTGADYRVGKVQASTREVQLGLLNASFIPTGQHDQQYERNLTLCKGCNLRRSFREFSYGKHKKCAICRAR